MRVAPVALYFAPDRCNSLDPMAFVTDIGASVAALTHGHPLGYIPAAALVYMIHRLIYDENTSNLEQITQDCIEYIGAKFKDKPDIRILKQLMHHAIQLSKQNIGDNDAVVQLGAGWVAEETLAIALYAVLKYQTNFKQAMVCAVNHSGDSDSTGAVAGNLLGALTGMQAIHAAFDLTKLELYDIIFEIAEDLFYG